MTSIKNLSEYVRLCLFLPYIEMKLNTLNNLECITMVDDHLYNQFINIEKISEELFEYIEDPSYNLNHDYEYFYTRSIKQLVINNKLNVEKLLNIVNKSIIQSASLCDYNIYNTIDMNLIENGEIKVEDPKNIKNLLIFIEEIVLRSNYIEFLMKNINDGMKNYNVNYLLRCKRRKNLKIFINIFLFDIMNINKLKNHVLLDYLNMDDKFVKDNEINDFLEILYDYYEIIIGNYISRKSEKMTNRLGKKLNEMEPLYYEFQD